MNNGNGYVLIQKALQFHWIAKNDAYFKAWVFMIFNVNYEPANVLIGNDLIYCDIGESLMSLDSWSDVFGKGWNRSKVFRFFKLLKKDNMIETKNEQKTTHLTIVNFKTYQMKENKDETINDEKTQPPRNDDEKIMKTIEIINKKELNKIKKESNITPLPTDEEFEKIWYEELTKRANKMNQQVWEFFDKTLSDSLLYDFTEYCKKIYPTKDRYKDYSAAARTWQGRDIKKLKSYNKKVESPQDQIEHKINYDYSHTYDNIKQWREIRPKNWKKIIVTDLCRIYNRDIFEQVANMEHLKSVDDPEVYINSIIEVIK